METSPTTRLFFPLFVLQLILGTIILVGLFRLGFRKTAVLEICKFAVVLPQAFRLRRATLEEPAPGRNGSPGRSVGVALLAISAFSDAVLISYDVQLGHLTKPGNL